MARSSKIALVVAALALSGCAQDSSEYSDFSKLVIGEFSGDNGITLNQASAIPYATIGVRLGSSPESVMVLATSAQEDRLWLAGQDAAVTTRHGIIVQTAGLPYNLNNIALLSEDPNTGESDYKYDLANPLVYGVLVHCKKHDVGSENLEILGAQISTVHSVQECEAPTIRWSFTNEFWRDPQTNYIWMSTQNTHPKQDAMQIRSLRPDENQ